MCGLDVAPISYLGGAFGGGGATPTYTVATFSLLPSDATAGQRCTVTGESGLTGVVVVNTAANTWEIETVTCAETVYGAVEWSASPSTWYSSGGITVTMAAGGTLRDSTYAMDLRWSTTISHFVPVAVYDWTLAGLVEIEGDSATPSGWAVTDTDADGTASITTASGRVTLSATTSAGASTDTLAQLQATDASLTSASKVYFRAIMQRTALTTATGTALWRYTLADGTDAYDFGSYQVNTSNTTVGQWYDGNTGTAYTAQSGTQGDIATARTLVEVIKLGTRAMARVGGAANPWVDLTGASARNSAGTVHAIRVQARRSVGTATATITVERAFGVRG